jgi:DNA polymerase III epsilon subunit-like protein
MNERPSDRAAAAHWARQVLSDERSLILDTETTGLGVFDQVVQIAVIDTTGAVLLDTLVKPTRPIPQIATGIHGITDEMVKDAPDFGAIYPALLMAIGGKRVVIYNKHFDIEQLHQSDQLYALESDTTWKPLGQDGWRGLAVWEDAMIPYSDWVGEWSEWHGDNRWQKLPGGDHTALGDARACLAIVKKMAGHLNSSITVPAIDDELRGYALHHSKFYKDGDYNVTHDSPLEAALSAFIADLVGSYSDRHGSIERERLANDWFNQWRRDLGWRPIYESQKKVENDAARYEKEHGESPF